MNTIVMRRRLLASTGLAVLSMAVAGPSLAQTAAADTSVSEIVVTGSRLPRVNIDAPTPVQVVGQERLQAQGFENITDILTTLPQFAPSYGTSRTQSTFSGAVSSGLNLTNLRQLGTDRSLTLLNGRRVPAGDVTGSAVDFNLLPSANISRIETITGGASAVYGADAVAGVINVITDTDFTGIEIGASYGAAVANWDNINPSAFIRGGMNLGDRGHIGATLQYDYQGKVSCRDRYLCAEDFAWNPPGAPNRSPTARSGVTPGGRFLVGAGNGLPAGDFTFDNGQLVTFSTALYGYNRNAQRTLAIPTERILFAADADFEIASGVTAFAELNYATAETDAPFEGHPFQSSSDTLPNGLEPSIPINNPFIPANLRARALAAGDTELTWFQRFDALGARGAINKRELSRVVAGFKGDHDNLFGFGSDWTWELSYTYGKTKLENQTQGLVNLGNLYNGLRVIPSGGTFVCADPAARAAGCVPVNPFDGYSADEQRYLVQSASIDAEQTLSNGLAYIGGSLFNLPAGPLRVGVGAETREVSAYVDYDQGTNLGIVTGNRIFDNPEVTFKTNEAFVETRVPILADVPFAQSLNLEGAFRWSDSELFGRYNTWNVGGDWSPIGGVRMRIMRAKAVRAPILDEINGGGETAGTVEDPCLATQRNANGARAAYCTSLGLPANYNPPLVVQQNVQGDEVGNPNLEPEEANTLTYGVVFNFNDWEGSPSWLRALTVSVDRFQIEIDDVIKLAGRQGIANLCADLGPGNTYCQLVTRGPDPLVQGTSGVLQAVNDSYANLGKYDVRGIDVQIGYGFEVGGLIGSPNDFGRFDMVLAASFLDRAKLTSDGTTQNLLGYAGGDTETRGFLRRQANLAVNYRRSQLGVNWNMRYIPTTKQSPFEAVGTPRIRDYLYHDLQVNYDVRENARIYLGVNNVFDEEPPFFGTSYSGTQALDTVPAYYDIFGRQLYAGFRAKF
jgi:iron complex outermembrane recepter protein